MGDDTGDVPEASKETLAYPSDAVSKPELPKCFGRYAVRRLLGEGTFGSVYLAHDPELDRAVAVKVPKSMRFRSQSEIDEFLAEARRAAKLDHPGIVAIYDVGRLGDSSCYVVMQYIDGQSLKEVLTSKQFSWMETARFLAQVSDAVHYAHTKELIHRDLKPSNLLVDRQGCPHVADFGLALAEDEQRAQAGNISGTPAYMSPEQVRGEVHRLDGRTDIWSLGVILYEMLAKRRPFSGTSNKELFDEIEHRPAKPPRQIDNTIPPAIERVCLKALSKEPSGRYNTAADLSVELRRGITGEEKDFYRSSTDAQHHGLSARFDIRKTGCAVSITFMSLLLIATVISYEFSSRLRVAITNRLKATLVESEPPGSVEPPPLDDHPHQRDPRPYSADVELQSKRAELRSRQAALQQALDAERSGTGTISSSEIRRLRFAHRLAQLEVERAEAILRGERDALRSIDYQIAEAEAELAEFELRQAVEANQEIPETVSQEELARLEDAHRRAQENLREYNQQ